MVNDAKTTLILVLCFVCAVGYVYTKKKFDIVWNVPSHKCDVTYGIKIPLSKFHIQFNRNQTFFGDLMNLFYEPTPGLYPRILQNGTFENGGLPQMTNISKHVTQEKIDILKMIPSEHFQGYAVIDWESWVPMFDRNSYAHQQMVYIKQSESLIHRRHPGWNSTRIEEEARNEFQYSARKLMEVTLNIARQLRPTGGWGFYGFPRCYNFRRGQANCSYDTQVLNDQLCWLFRASTVTFPSIYLTENWGSAEERRIRVRGIINEAFRVQKSCGIQKPILAYSRYRYSDTEKFYKIIDLKNTIQQSLDAGLNGLIFWDTSRNFLNIQDCLQLQTYITEILGPFLMEL